MEDGKGLGSGGIENPAVQVGAGFLLISQVYIILKVLSSLTHPYIVYQMRRVRKMSV